MESRPHTSDACNFTKLNEILESDQVELAKGYFFTYFKGLCLRKRNSSYLRAIKLMNYYTYEIKKKTQDMHQLRLIVINHS